MKKLRETIEQYGRWKELEIYIDRIEGHLESIGKEICTSRNVELPAAPSINSVLKKAFCAIGYSNETLVNKVSGSLANIAQELGNLRNEISPTSHGKSIDELRERNNKVDLLTREFLIDSTLVVAIFLIRAFEERNEAAILDDDEITKDILLNYDELEDFNEFWDDAYGEFEMGDYSYVASEILFSVDYKAYKTEYNIFQEDEIESEKIKD
jgi:Abortive infection C-terminus